MRYATTFARWLLFAWLTEHLFHISFDRALVIQVLWLLSVQAFRTESP